MSLLRERLKQGAFVVTSEVAPPKGTDISESLREAEILAKVATAINVTDNQSAVMRADPVALCRKMLDKNIEPIYQIVCRDKNRLAIQSSLLGAAILGVENLLSLTGDPPQCGDHPETKVVFDLDSIKLMDAARTLRSGKDMAGKPLKGTPSFFIGAAMTPTNDNTEQELSKTKAKIAGGAEFFQTQAVFDVAKFNRFVQLLPADHPPIIAGIIVLKSVKMAEYMAKNIPGIFIPQPLMERLKNTGDPLGEGIEIASELVSQLKGLAQGVHIMPIGQVDAVIPIIQKAAII
ncbi:MAG: methylenetetrahydrofolate reductase [Candidatus Omnitrophica bacterium]|nr:methylenetetrahydrofolate reductase [Candidatus Omnitrophota bacterium]